MENNRVEKDGIIEVKSVEVLEAINRAEVDIQIATAKKYPEILTRH